MKIAFIIARYLLGTINIIAGIGKLWDSETTEEVLLIFSHMSGLDFIGDPRIWVLIISIFELIVGLWIILGKYLVYALYTQFIFVIILTLPLIFLWINSAEIENCGCFGALGVDTSLLLTILKNIVILGITYFAIYYAKRMATSE